MAFTSSYAYSKIVFDQTSNLSIDVDQETVDKDTVYSIQYHNDYLLRRWRIVFAIKNSDKLVLRILKKPM